MPQIQDVKKKQLSGFCIPMGVEIREDTAARNTERQSLKSMRKNSRNTGCRKKSIITAK